VISRNGTAVGRGSAARDREEAVVAQLHSLAPHLDGEPDAAFRAATRARLVAMAAVRSPEPQPVSPLRRLLAARPTDTSPSPWRTRLTAGLAGAALTVTALSTLVALSADARPGDVLYGLKRGTEQTQLAVAGDSRGRTLLDFAGTRLDELEYLVSEDATALPSAAAAPGAGPHVVLAAGADPRLVIDTLDTMDDQTADGAAWLGERAVTTEDTAPLSLLAGWADGQSAGLAAVQPDVPEAAQAALDDSLRLLTAVRTRAAGLQSAVDCTSGPATDGFDRLGPVPGTCAAGPSTPPADGGDPGTTPGTAGTSGATPPSGRSGEVPGTATGEPGSSVPGSGVPEVDVPGGPPTEGVPGSGLPPLPSTGIVPSTPALPTLPLPGVPTVPTVPTVPVPSIPAAPSVGLDVGICPVPSSIGAC
jgi:hypothetical protein